MNDPGNKTKPALIRQHDAMTPPGLLAEWMEDRGIPFEIHNSWLEEPVPNPGEYSFMASLGSPHSPRDTHESTVLDELALVGDAVEKDVPVLGLCFGGEVLSAVLGGEVERAEAPELGWREIESDDPEKIPPGPWLEWHYERFTVPPGAVEVARTKDAVQAFRFGPHLAVQFHPESTVKIVSRWAAHDTERLGKLGVHDPATILHATPEEEEAAKDAAFRLFDAFLEDTLGGHTENSVGDSVGGKEE